MWPNAEAVYYRVGAEGQLEGAVRVSSDSLAFRFRGDDLDRVHSVGRPEGLYYDAGIVPEPLRLDGYRYRPEWRPTRAGLLGEGPLDRHRGSPPETEPPPEPAAPGPNDEPPPAVPSESPSPPTEVSTADPRR